jgi:hypothetical protein
MTRHQLHPPTSREVLKQVKFDLFGKDVQETPTVSYVWMADQGGHIALGFIPTIVIVKVVFDQLLVENMQDIFGIGDDDRSSLIKTVISAAVVMLIWSVKEITDYRREKGRFAASTKYFAFNAAELWRNVRIALFFFLVGATLAVATELHGWHPWLVLVVLILAVLWRSKSWLQQKITFQQAGLPFLYRLASFDGKIANPVPPSTAIDFINELCDPQRKPTMPRHLVIAGPLDTGKSSLAAAIGTEYAFRLGIGRYITMIKLVQSVERKKQEAKARAANAGPPTGTQAPPSNQGSVQLSDQQEYDDGRILWHWPSVDLLIIDDVAELVLDGAAAVRRASFATDQQQINAINAAIAANQSLIAALKQIPQIVWVVSDSIQLNAFVTFLNSAFGLANDNPPVALELQHLPAIDVSTSTRH